MIECLEKIKTSLEKNIELKHLCVVLNALTQLITENNPNDHAVISSHFSALRHCLRYFLGKCELSEALTPFISSSGTHIPPEDKETRLGSVINPSEDNLERAREEKMVKEQHYLDSLKDQNNETVLRKFLFDCWARCIQEKHPSKKFFVSYAYPKPLQDPHHESHVKDYLAKLIEHFIQMGMQVFLDQFHSGPGKLLGNFMGKIDEIVITEKEVYAIDHVLAVSSRTLPDKLRNPYSGCFCEYRNMRQRIEKERSHRFVIPVLLNRQNYLPENFKQIVGIDFCETPYLENFKQLLQLVHDRGEHFMLFCDEKIKTYGLGMHVYIARGLQEKYCSTATNIQRLMYTDSISITEGFTNVAVVKEEEYQEREQRLRKNNNGPDSESSGDYSPTAVVALNLLCTPDTTRTYIEGRAGIGKTTLLQYFAHQWAQAPTERKATWLSRYDAVVWLPLRRLHEYDETLDLSTFIHRECFSSEYQQKILPEMIQKYLLGNSRVSILFLLDGLDEVATLLHKSRHSELLTTLCAMPNWVLTSRPGCQYDKKKWENFRHLQNIGFLGNSTETYVRMFFDQQKSKANSLLEKMNSHASLKNIAHVPINLELICSIWDIESEPFEDDAETLTVAKLYEKVIILLLKRYLLRIQELQPNLINGNVFNLMPDEILTHPLCQTPLIFLQELAWQALQQKTVIISGKAIQAIFKKVFGSKNRDQNIDNLFKHLFILKPTGPTLRSALDQNYYFTPLSFQDFFIAKYLLENLLNEDAFTRSPLNKAFITQETQVLQFLAEMVENDAERIQRLRNILLASKGRPDIAIAASNAITILNAANVAFLYEDLDGVQIPRANLSGAMLWGSSLRQADLTNVILEGACLENVDLAGAKAKGIDFGQWPYLQLRKSFNAFAFSTNRKFFALGFNKTIEIYTTDTGKLVKQLKGHSTDISCLTFDSSGKYLASATTRSEIAVWDIGTGNISKSYNGHRAKVSCIAFNETSEKLATGSFDDTVILWDLPTGKKMYTLKGHTDSVTCLVFHDEGSRLFSGSADASIRSWDINTGKELSRTKRHSKDITCLAIHHRSKKLASSSKDSFVHLWDISNGITEVAFFKGHTGPVDSVTFNSTGEKLASAGEDETVRLWSTFTKTELNSYCGHTVKAIEVAFAPDEERLLSVDTDGCLRFWGLKNSTRAKLRSLSPGKTRAIAVNAKSKIVATAENNAILFWDLSTGKALPNLKKNATKTNFLQFDASDDTIAFATDRIVSVIQTDSSKELTHFKQPDSWLKQVAFILNEKRVFFSCKDGSARLWDLLSHKELFYTKISPNSACVAADSKNEQFAFVEETGFVAVFSSQHGIKILQNITDNQSEPNEVISTPKSKPICLHFDSNGRRLMSGDNRGIVRIWDCTTLNLVLTLPLRTNSLSHVMFNPEGDKFLSLSSTSSLSIYEINTKKCLLNLNFENSISSITWEKVDGENVIVIAYGKSLVCYVENSTLNSFSLTMKWINTEQKLVLKNIQVDQVNDLEEKNKTLISQLSKTSKKKNPLSLAQESVMDIPSNERSILTTAFATQTEDQTRSFYSIVTGESYQPIIIVYDIIDEAEFLSVLNKLKCIKKIDDSSQWYWNWEEECKQIDFHYYSDYEKNSTYPELLGIFSVINHRCYLVLPSFRRALLATPFLHKVFAKVARIHGALLANKLFSAGNPFVEEVNYFFDILDGLPIFINQNKEDSDGEWEDSFLTDKDRLRTLVKRGLPGNGKPLAPIEYFRFEPNFADDPEASYTQFRMFLLGHEMTLKKNWAGDLSYTLSDAADESAQKFIDSFSLEGQLIKAVEDQDFSKTEHLLEKNADVLVKDSNNDTLFHHIARTGNTQLAEQILFYFHEKTTDSTLSLGDLINSKNKLGETPLHIAAENGFKDLCELLLDMGSQLDTFNENEDSPIDCAAYQGHEDTVVFLLSRCTNPSVANNAFIAAACGGQQNIIELFISRQLVDPRSRNNYGRTALHVASREGHAMIVARLLEIDFNINEQDTEFGNTPLHWAVEKGHELTVNVLLASDADSSIENTAGQTPKMLAFVRNQIEVFEIFCSSSTLDSRIQFYQEQTQFSDVASRAYHHLSCCFYIKALQQPENAERSLLQSEDYFLRALKMPTCGYATYTEYANFLIRNNKYDEAISYLKRVVESENDQDELIYGPFDIFLVEEKLKKLIISNNKITICNKLYAIYLLILCYLSLGKSNNANHLIPLLHRQVYRNRTQTSFLILGWALEACGKMDEAQQAHKYTDSRRLTSELELDIIFPLLNRLVIQIESSEKENEDENPTKKNHDFLASNMTPFGTFESNAPTLPKLETIITCDTKGSYRPTLIVYDILDQQRLVDEFNGLKCCKRMSTSTSWCWYLVEECKELLPLDDEEKSQVQGEFLIEGNKLYLKFNSLPRAGSAIRFLHKRIELISQPNFILFVNQDQTEEDKSEDYESIYLKYGHIDIRETIPVNYISRYQFSLLGIDGLVFDALLRICERIIVSNLGESICSSLDNLFNSLNLITIISNLLIEAAHIGLNIIKLSEGGTLSTTLKEEYTLLLSHLNEKLREAKKMFSVLINLRIENTGLPQIIENILIDIAENKISHASKVFSRISQPETDYHNLACEQFAQAVHENNMVRMEEAETTFQSALAARQTSKIFTEYAIFLLKNERVTEATEYLSKAFEEKSGGELFYEQRHACTLPRELQPVVEHHKKISVDTKILAYYLAGLCYQQLNQPNRFLALLPSFEEDVLSSENFLYHILCSYTCKRYGLFDKATFYFENALKLNPGHPVSKEELTESQKAVAPKTTPQTDALFASKESFWREVDEDMLSEASQSSSYDEEEELKRAIELSKTTF